MNSLNRAQIIGNLTRDPEVRQTPSGQAVATVGVATNRRWKDRQSGEDREQTEFHNVVVWARLAEIVQQYLKKGDKVYFEGRLQTRSWEGEDGKKNYRTEIVAENMIMLGRGGMGSGGGYGGGQGGGEEEAGNVKAQSKKPAGGAKKEEASGGEEEEEIKVEDLPF